MKRSLAHLSVLTLALGVSAVPAVAATSGPADAAPSSVSNTDWIADAPEFPVEAGTPVDSLTDEDKRAIAAFQKEFPWEEAFASYGCDATNIVIDDDGAKSMLLDCDESTVPLDEVAQISTTAIAAADGLPSAVAAVEAGDVIDSDEVVTQARSGQPTFGVLGSACGNRANQRHCLTNNASPYFAASSTIRTLSGTSTGVNRLGAPGFGASCGNGTFLADSVRLTISTSTSSYVEAPSYSSTQLSSRWTISATSYSQYCANV